MTVTLTTRRNTAPTSDVELYYLGQQGETATRGDDYTPPSGSALGAGGVFFATVRPSAFSPNAAGTAWVAERAFTIGIIDDQHAEVAETIVFTVESGPNRTSAQTITIRDNDAIGPGRPTGLQAAPTGQTRIQLSWTAPADVGSFAITGYKIEVSENAGGRWHVLVADTRDPRTDKAHTGLSAGDTRHYRVSAINPAGTSAPSGVASATTVAAGPAATNSALPPPQDVRAVPKLPGEILLSWWRNPDAESHDLVDRHQYRYRVRNASTWTVDWTTVNQTALPGTTETRNYNSVLLKGLTARTTYEFQVRSVDKGGRYSEAVSALGTAVGGRTIWIQADTRSVEEGEPLRFTLSRDQRHGRLMVILRISETGDMLPPGGRTPEGYWHEQVHFGDGNETIPVVLETVNDRGGPEPNSAVTVEVMPYPLYPDNPNDEPLYEVLPDLGSATRTVTAAGGSSRGGEAEPLTAAFEGLPEAHDGEPGVWAITVTPDTREALSITLAPTVACEADSAVCTADGQTLSNGLATLMPGPGPESQTQEVQAALTASFEGLPAAHDGERAFRFRVAFSEDIGTSFKVLRDESFTTSGISDTDGLDTASFAYQWIRAETDIRGATGSTYTPVAVDQGQRLKVRVSFTDDASHEERLTSTATDAVAAPPSEPLTASFSDVPTEHTGEAFTFGLTFSEDVAGLSFKTLRDQAFTVTGGAVRKAQRRQQGRNQGWNITV